MKPTTFIKFEYRKHTCIVFKENKKWDAEITPPNGLACSWMVSPFRSRFIGKTIDRVIKQVDEDILREDQAYVDYMARYDSEPLPKIHS